MTCDSLSHKSQLTNSIMFAQMLSIRTFLVMALDKCVTLTSWWSD